MTTHLTYANSESLCGSANLIYHDGDQRLSGCVIRLPSGTSHTPSPEACCVKVHAWPAAACTSAHLRARCVTTITFGGLKMFVHRRACTATSIQNDVQSCNPLDVMLEMLYNFLGDNLELQICVIFPNTKIQSLFSNLACTFQNKQECVCISWLHVVKNLRQSLLQPIALDDVVDQVCYVVDDRLH